MDTGTLASTTGPEWIGRAPQQELQPNARPLLRSEEHTSELQSHSDLVCRLLLEKKKHAREHPLDDVGPARDGVDRKLQLGILPRLVAERTLRPDRIGGLTDQ